MVLLSLVGASYEEKDGFRLKNIKHTVPCLRYPGPPDTYILSREIYFPHFKLFSEAAVLMFFPCYFFPSNTGLVKRSDASLNFTGTSLYFSYWQILSLNSVAEM